MEILHNANSVSMSVYKGTFVAISTSIALIMARWTKKTQEISLRSDILIQGILVPSGSAKAYVLVWQANDRV